jgi:hypothetical protein
MCNLYDLFFVSLSLVATLPVSLKKKLPPHEYRVLHLFIEARTAVNSDAVRSVKVSLSLIIMEAHWSLGIGGNVRVL